MKSYENHKLSHPSSRLYYMLAILILLPLIDYFVICSLCASKLGYYNSNFIIISSTFQNSSFPQLISSISVTVYSKILYVISVTQLIVK